MQLLVMPLNIFTNVLKLHKIRTFLRILKTELAISQLMHNGNKRSFQAVITTTIRLRFDAVSTVHQRSLSADVVR